MALVKEKVGILLKETRDDRFILKKMEGIFCKRPWRRGNRLCRSLDLDSMVEMRSGGGGVTSGEPRRRRMAEKVEEITVVVGYLSIPGVTGQS